MRKENTMDFDTFLKIALVVLAIVSWGAYHFTKRIEYVRMNKNYRIERYMK